MFYYITYIDPVKYSTESFFLRYFTHFYVHQNTLHNFYVLAFVHEMQETKGKDNEKYLNSKYFYCNIKNK
jgi:hypothetical protein